MLDFYFKPFNTIWIHFECSITARYNISWIWHCWTAIHLLDYTIKHQWEWFCYYFSSSSIKFFYGHPRSRFIFRVLDRGFTSRKIRITLYQATNVISTHPLLYIKSWCIIYRSADLVIVTHTYTHVHKYIYMYIYIDTSACML